MKNGKLMPRVSEYTTSLDPTNYLICVLLRIRSSVRNIKGLLIDISIAFRSMSCLIVKWSHTEFRDSVLDIAIF